MATTPPAQIRAEARTPPTPLHGSAYHSNPSSSRYNTRSSKRLALDSTHSSFTESPRSPRSSRTPRSPPRDVQLNIHSPQATPKRKSARRVQVTSPASPNSISDPAAQPRTQNQNYLSATTVLSEGMLPTPVKTPQKKRIPKSSMTARLLFQDQLNDAQSSPRKQQKKRHNGFSLETENEAAADIAIFTDSRDQVPQVDDSPSNPFYAPPKSKKRSLSSRLEAVSASGSSKRRKISIKETRKLDPQVAKAIQKDEGMVYLFRGKKVYRRFDDADDEEEVIDPEALGLLERQPDAREIVKPLKTLTRKSIRPKRLFQQEQQPSQSDEEAETEIEDNDVGPSGADNADDVEDPEEQPSPSRSTRSQTKKIGANGRGKKESPFDSWPRLKAGSRSSSVKGRKRTAAEALEV